MPEIELPCHLQLSALCAHHAPCQGHTAVTQYPRCLPEHMVRCVIDFAAQACSSSPAASSFSTPPLGQAGAGTPRSAPPSIVLSSLGTVPPDVSFMETPHLSTAQKAQAYAESIAQWRRTGLHEPPASPQQQQQQQEGSTSGNSQQVNKASYWPWLTMFRVAQQ